MPRFIFLLMLFSAGWGHAAGVYKWTDAQGNVHFGDAPNPAAEQVRLSPMNSYHSGVVPEDVFADGPDIIMYGAQWCSVCKRARAYFERRGVAYTEYDIDNSRRGRREYERLNGTGVPLFLVDGQRVSGFSEERFGRLLAGKARR